MRMALHFEHKALFFIKPLLVEDETIFWVSCGLVLLYAVIFTYLVEKNLKNRIPENFEPFLDFVNMFILMSYSFWVVLAYLLGKILGYSFYCYFFKRSLNNKTDYTKVY